MDWFKGKLKPESPVFHWKIYIWFPVDFPLNQSIERSYRTYPFQLIWIVFHSYLSFLEGTPFLDIPGQDSSLLSPEDH